MHSKVGLVRNSHLLPAFVPQTHPPHLKNMQFFFNKIVEVYCSYSSVNQIFIKLRIECENQKILFYRGCGFLVKPTLCINEH